MKLEITQVTQKEIEVQLPCYVKSKQGMCFYLVKNEQESIQVFDSIYTGNSIQQVHTSVAFQEGFQIIKASDYKEAFSKVLNKLL
jgi:hypothetical protein